MQGGSFLFAEVVLGAVVIVVLRVLDVELGIEVITFNRYLQRKSPNNVEPKSFALTLQATDWESP